MRQSCQRSAISGQPHRPPRRLALLSGLHLLDSDGDSLLTAKRFGFERMAITLKAVGDRLSQTALADR
jgi:hypothetical protein